MEDYKTYLNEYASENERQTAARIMDGLQGLRMEAKLRVVKAERVNCCRPLPK